MDWSLIFDNGFKISKALFKVPLLHGPDQDICQVSNRVGDSRINLSLPDLVDRFRYEFDHVLTVFNLHVRRGSVQGFHAVLLTTQRLRFPSFVGLRWIMEEAKVHPWKRGGLTARSVRLDGLAWLLE